MSHIVTDNCIACKYTDCVSVCPVDCFHEGPNFMVINPVECIDCGLCVPECDAKAIFQQEELAQDQSIFIALNAELAQIWPNQTEVKPAMDQADYWNSVPDKLPLLKREQNQN